MIWTSKEVLFYFYFLSYSGILYMMKTLVWDFNGTIVDDTELCLAIENEMLEARGMRSGYTVEEYRDMFCFPIKKYYRILGYDFKEESYEELSVEFNEKYDAGFPYLKLVPGCLELLEYAKKNGVHNVIVSATRQSTLEKECEILDISSYFETLVGIADDLASSKVESAVRWMKGAKVNPKDCIVIGDSIHDLETAQAIQAGDCFLVACGHQSYQVLKKSHDKVFHTLEEVEPYLR